MIKVLAAELRSKKRSGDEAFEIFSRLRRPWWLHHQLSLNWYSGSAAKSHSPSTQYCRLRRLLLNGLYYWAVQCNIILSCRVRVNSIIKSSNQFHSSHLQLYSINTSHFRDCPYPVHYRVFVTKDYTFKQHQHVTFNLSLKDKKNSRKNQDTPDFTNGL